MDQVELLAPAGNLEKLKAALHYGADAVYAGGVQYSLRERSGNFTEEEFRQAVEYTHHHGKKIYVAVNIYAHNRDLQELPAYLEFLASLKVDAIILSDPGVMSLAKKHAPAIPLHLSTQASTTNHLSANYWKEQGISRIVLARELSAEEIHEITQKVDMEFETFVHGAQCMAYSGRCLISNYLAHRGANQGDCAQSCRWNYSLVEAKRPDEFHAVEEDSRGTYFFNSKDLALIEHLPKVIETGISTLKIEGRVKSLHYVSTVVRAYREAIDNYYETLEKKNLQTTDATAARLFQEVSKVSHRDYSSGFFFGNPGEEGQSYESSRPMQGIQFLGIVDEASGQNAWIDVRGKFSIGDSVEVMKRRLSEDFIQKITSIRDENGEEISFTKPNTRVQVTFESPLEPYDLLRMA